MSNEIIKNKEAIIMLGNVMQCLYDYYGTDPGVDGMVSHPPLVLKLHNF